MIYGHKFVNYKVILRSTTSILVVFSICGRLKISNIVLHDTMIINQKVVNYKVS
jgi:hypothetical protein